MRKLCELPRSVVQLLQAALRRGDGRNERGQGRPPRRPRRAAARPLPAYAGEYEHPGYGTLSIALDGNTLKPSLGTMDLSLVHRHYETFDLTWHEVGNEPAVFPLTFWSNPNGVFLPKGA